MRVLDLFAGIGGFSLGLERAGFETVAFCEIEPYAQKVLAKHWPGVPIYDDVRALTADRLASDGIGVDVITGGFPCQDISVAGNRAGIEGERSGLWGELARLIGELRPRYAIMENVSALLSGGDGGWFGKVIGDLAEIGYDAEWHCIPASELGAHHHRDRVWIIAYPSSERGGEAVGRSGRQCEAKPAGLQPEDWEAHAGHARALRADVADANRKRLQGSSLFRSLGAGGKRRQQLIARQFRPTWENGSPEPTVCGVANGIPRRVDRLRCLGNAVVPQIPELIGRAIMEAESA